MKKLFDLQTGKYLERKDWLDGGEAVHVKIDYDDKNRFYDITDSMNDMIYQGSYCDCNQYKDWWKDEEHELNTKWNGLFKDCVYGDRYVVVNYSNIDDNIYKVGDIYVTERKNYGIVALCDAETHYSYHCNVIDIPKFQGNCCAGISCYEAMATGYNLLEEYSKQLRGKENKLNELEELLK